MGLRSTLDIEVNDQQFKDFEAAFSKYQEKLQKMPGAWAGVDKKMKSSFETVAAALLAQNEVINNARKKTEELEKNSKKTSSFWRDLAKSTKTVAGNIKDATSSLLKWASISGVISGLVGGGGLFGLDLLAVQAGGARRSSLGLGTSIGAQRAFSTNYGRVVDSDSLLTGVNTALHDVTKRYLLYNAGLTNPQLASGDTTTVSLQLIENLKKLADRTPTGLLGQVLQSRGLDQFVSLQDFERLKNTPASELAEYRRSFNRDRGDLALNDRSARAWQDFDVQLNRAGRKIENAFVLGLDPLIRSGVFTKLSNSLVDLTKNLLGSAGFKQFLSDFEEGLKGFASYLTSPAFKSDLSTFTQDIGALARSTHNALMWLGIVPEKPSASNAKAGYTEAHRGFLRPTIFTKPGTVLPTEQPGYHWWNPISWFNTSGVKMSGYGLFGSIGTGRPDATNPGNLRPLDGNGYLHFKTAEDGIRGLARQLQIYQDRHQVDTIAGIINRFAPAADHNNVAAYIADVTKRTGFNATQHLNLHDQAVLSKLISAITKHENKKNNYAPGAVVEILNNTGGNVQVASNQIAK